MISSDEKVVTLQRNVSALHEHASQKHQRPPVTSALQAAPDKRDLNCEPIKARCRWCRCTQLGKSLRNSSQKSSDRNISVWLMNAEIDLECRSLQ